MFFSFLIVRLLDFWTARRKDGFPLETREARTCCPETLSNTALFFSLQIYQVKANETRPNLTKKVNVRIYFMPCFQVFTLLYEMLFQKTWKAGTNI